MVFPSIFLSYKNKAEEYPPSAISDYAKIKIKKAKEKSLAFYHITLIIS